MKYTMGIDIGTSSTKTVLFDKEGNIVSISSSSYPLYQPENGWAEQEAEDWWKAVCKTSKEVVKKSGVDARDIVGVGLSGQMHGLVMLDKEGRVLNRSIIWSDQRTDKEVVEITEKIGRDNLIRITGSPASTGFTAAKILWVKKNLPEIYKRCRHILLPKDYIRYKLTGDFATDVSDASGMQVFDINKRDWSYEILDKLDIDPSLLGKVYESQEITGRLSKEAAALTMLSEGTVLVGGAGDNAATAIGTARIKDGHAFTTIGTSGVVYAHTSLAKTDKEGRMHTFCSAVPGQWHVMGVTQAAGYSLEWFKENIYCGDGNRDNFYSLMDREASKVRIGSDKLIYLPYLMGERTPHLDPHARGLIFGLSGIHTESHILRAFMEGVAFSLKDCIEVIKENNIHIDSMVLCGGGSKSQLWHQMLADLFSCPVSTVKLDHSAASGVAILAGVGSGLFEDIEEGTGLFIQKDLEKQCDRQASEEYQRYYELYRELYRDLKKSFQKLSQL